MKKQILFIFILFLSISPLFSQNEADSVQFYVQNFNFKKALEYIDKQDKSVSIQFQEAMCYKALGDNKKAISILKELVRENPSDLRLRTELAQCYERSSRWRETSDSYADLMAIDSTNLYFFIKRSEAEINRKNYGGAIEQLKGILTQDSLVTAMKLIGKSYENINQLDSALQYYNMAWTLDSTDVYSAANLVNTSLKANKYLDALVFSDAYQKIDSTNKQMNMLKGYTHFALDDDENTIMTLEKCYMQGDSSLIVIRTLGLSYFNLGDNECSYRYLDQAYRQDTTNTKVLYNLAVASNELAKSEEAIVYFGEMLNRLIPSNMQLYLNYRGLGKAYEGDEKYQDAVLYYIRALEYATTDQRTYLLHSLATVYDGKLNDPRNALMYYRQYRGMLNGQIIYMEDQDEHDLEEIKNLKESLGQLDKYIVQLEGDIKGSEAKKQKDTLKESLFILDGEVVDTLPVGKMRSWSTFVIKEGKDVPEKFKKYASIAKEKGKTILYLVESEKEDVAN